MKYYLKKVYFSDFPAQQILVASKDLKNFLRSRLPPIEHSEVRQKKNEIKQRLIGRSINSESTFTAEETEMLNEKLKMEISRKFKQEAAHWKPVEYDIYKSLQYLLGRSAAEYAVLYKIFNEINSRDPMFKPNSFFDFGSGIGTGTW